MAPPRRPHPDELAAVAWLGDADHHQRQQLSDRLVRRTYAEGEEVLTEGDAGDVFVLVLTGALSAARHGGDGRWIRLDDAGPGSVVGELSLLCGTERRATVTATAPTEAAVGGVDALEALLAVPGATERLTRLAAARLAVSARPVAITVGDAELAVRPLLPSDRDDYAAALLAQPDEWRVRRFFTPVRPSPALVDYLVSVDFVGHFAWLVGTPHPPTGIGVGRYVRSVHDQTCAEVAFEVDDRWRGKGVGTSLLGAVAVAAEAAGIETLTAEVLRDNAAMRGVFDKAGARWRRTEPGVSEASFSVTAALGLIDDDARHRLAASVTEVVTGAGLAVAPGV